MARSAEKDKGVLPTGFLLVGVSRFLTNVAIRLVFPFLPRISAGLGASLPTMGAALAGANLAGVVSPVLGRAADGRGHTNAMVVGLSGLAAAMVLQGAAGGLTLFVIGLIMANLTKNLFDVGSAGWVGDAVPYRTRGRAMGYLETSWALSFIVAMPLAALLIRATTWRTPFLVTGAAILVVSVITFGTLPRVAQRPSGDRPPAIAWSRSIGAGLVAICAMGVAHSMMLVAFASWLEDEHGLSVEGLGFTAIIIGLAELGGSTGSALLSDRLGLVRVVRVTLAMAAASCLLLPLGNSSLVVAYAVLAAHFVVVEFAIVALLSLFTELDPNARGAVVGLFFAGFSVGHAAGAILGARVYSSLGMNQNAVGMAIALTVAWIAVRAYLQDPGEAATT